MYPNFRSVLRVALGMFVLAVGVCWFGPAAMASPSRDGSRLVAAPAASLPPLELVGSAVRLSDRVRLTSLGGTQAGAAWATTRVGFDGQFAATFSFQISSGRADGFAFVIQNASLRALGAPGGSLGYARWFDGTGGIPASLAVEFDTYQNVEWGDPGGADYVSVHTLGIEPNSPSEAASISGSIPLPSNIADGGVHSVTISYFDSVLTVFVDRQLVLQSGQIDLTDRLGLDEGDGRAWVGFTGATAAAQANQDILEFAFTDEADCAGAVPTILGTPGDDRIVAGANRDVIAGLGGDDVLVGGSGATLCGGAGNDFLDARAGGGRLRGGDGNDRIVDKGRGFSLIEPGAGDDLVDARGGLDTLSYAESPHAVEADLGGGQASGWGNDRVTGFENVVGTRFDDVLIGTGARNTFEALAGNDVMRGRAGVDTVLYRSAASGVGVDLASGTASGDGSDRLTGIEDVYGSNYDDVLLGDSRDNILEAWGGTGSEVIRGRGGNDTLYGVGGSDRLEGGKGNDYVEGRAGSDRIGGGAGDDFLLGSRGDDLLIGGAGSDQLEGEGGNDTFLARDGARDRLYGHSGHDVARVDRRLDISHGIERFLP